MSDFLLELLSEEIPARMQEKASADLARLFADELAKAGLKPERLTSHVTPRRLALIAHGLPVETAAVSEELKGPKASAPPQALEGFLRKTGLTREQLVERDGILFAVIEKPGRATAAVLAEAIPAIVRAFPWPKSMRWGTASASTASLRWVRPLQGIVALLGEDIVPFEIDGVASGAATVGHRFHHPGIITIGSAADYVEKLRACHVIVDHAERRDIIRARAAELAAEASMQVIPDEGLVAENAGLTEWPVPLLGRFDPAFLEVPREVIQLTLRTNQKYFVLNDAEGRLAPAFICTANITAKDGGAAIVAGNGKVLAARLSDAKFFWEQDLKVPLAEQAKKLDQIVFHEKLGTVADKVDRVAKLARWLVESDIVTPAKAGVSGGEGGTSSPEMPASAGMTREEIADMVEQAARLAKADLVTGMVGEFPELQGVIGGYYARAEGLPDAVADAIRDHYKPVGQGDEVPVAPVTVAVSLADKLDSLSQFFAEDMKPTGSKDPFALRRAGLGILELLTVNEIRAHLFGAINHAIGLRKAAHPVRVDEIVQFLIDRLKVQQREAGVRHDLIDAVFALGGESDLVRLLARVKALQAFVETEDGANLLAGYKRAANILKKEGGVPEGASAVPDYQPEVAESVLIAALDAAEPKAAAAVAAEDFAGAMSALATLRGPIDAFFDQVIVNDPESSKRNTRLALLEKIRVAVHNVADFSNIEG
ncbi:MULTISPECIES: glycine--tRNA ligase subunit beta [unclassified Sphingomonas]|uniref:glycine--tRNA ligase subunit beta n=1 Tax=unclassified Sphingomonas TaxID=196159 RepID=UPI0006FC7788|nr:MULTISPECIES: glycine--tRNA ligase subunit beta [unclassified Sphingomonas]KQX20264.1 glycine--tRNA ligase subunit beta [Sphingomonas sp. Root1294]KQY67514.1 glycine--tRNA ligase subunit beta [Sphingomonas sp. Root50]KRB90891.1 glycine--tRNA ligase subunit beta [Sphingomonas sp. Root720]